jgi:hypothetical protein
MAATAAGLDAAKKAWELACLRIRVCVEELPSPSEGEKHDRG